MFYSYCIFHIIYSILKFEINPFFSPDYPVCAICETANNEQVVKLGEKGCQGLREASKSRGKYIDDNYVLFMLITKYISLSAVKNQFLTSAKHE